MTESKTPLTSEKASEPSNKVNSGKGTVKKSDTKNLPPKPSSSKISKLAIFALLIAVAAPSGHYYWQQLQSQQLAQALTQKIDNESNATLTRNKNQVEKALRNQEQVFAKQLQQMAAKISNTSLAKITELDETVKQLKQQIKQRQPSDWLLHEAEYLIRISSRTLWLEHDTSAAIGLLKDADARLTELNDPAFLPVRETIHQDIKSLEVLPKLDTDEVVLTLMALNKQVMQLPLAIVDIDGEKNKESGLNLSDDINDWQTNLAKTWQIFLNDFIRVRQRTGSLEPLMSPKQQENLKQSLSLKIQLALWAASERKGDVYQQSLADILQWLNEFFDIESNANQQFAKTLIDLKNKQINYNYPSELNSLTSIRTTLREQQISSSLPPKNTDAMAEKKPLESAEKEVKPESKSQVQPTEKQEDKLNDGGNI